MPVNAIGPRVNLNPGSISVAVDRLYRKGLVSRVESTCDRRVRTVSLTESGKELFVPVFRRHMALIKKAFADIPQCDLELVEATLRKIGKRAEVLAGKGVSAE
jgi:MarR family transcriptional regulator, 2-MHQ and catechol-resistance regulon repressor